MKASPLRSRFRCFSCRLRRARLQQRNHSGTTTYYDSQSGIHVPIHNESDIFVYKHWVNPFFQLYKSSEDAFEAKEELKELSTVFDGVFLSSSIVHPRDERNLETLCHIAPNISEGFTLFAPSLRSTDAIRPNVVVLCNYLETSPDKLKEYKQNEIKTAICLGEYSDDSSEPFELANQVANLMDETGAGDYLLVSASSQQDDSYMVQLCEELSYLDVPGPTIKSRLVLDCVPEAKEDLVDEVMMIGVNKFLVTDELQRDCIIQTVAEEQGKKLVKSFSE